jgi:DNA-binding IclR family transcriptional regulator
LNRQTRETIHLTVRRGLSAVYVEKLESPEPLRTHSRIGAVVPLFCTAVGKVILAYMPNEERETVFPQLELNSFTTNTVGNLQERETELCRVRRNGYACDLEEQNSHPLCRGTTWDHAGRVNASLSIIAPMIRMAVSRIRQLAPLIQAAGLPISRDLGYQAVSDSSPLRKNSPAEVLLAKTV